MAKKNQRQTFSQMLEVDRRTGSIPVPEASKLPLVFSFAHMDHVHAKFGLKSCTADKAEWAQLFFERVAEACKLSISEFRQGCGNPKSWRSHSVDFSTTTEKAGFQIKSTVWHDSSWQFQLAKTKGRVIGYLTGNVFNVVWLDPEHALWPS